MQQREVQRWRGGVDAVEVTGRAASFETSPIVVGDEALRFDDFVQSASGPLYRLAVARTGSAPDAQDLVQDTLIETHRRWETVRGYDEPLLWARRVLLNRSTSRWRRRNSERGAIEKLIALVPDPPELDFVEADEALWAAVRSLPRRQCAVVLLLWFEDRSVAEVAETLDCSEATVRTHWRRARVRLSELLGEADDEQEWS